MILGAYKIGGIPVSDLTESFLTEDLNGNPAFKIFESAVTSEYQDISSMENWDKYGESLIGSVEGFRDWKSLRNEIKTQALTISGGNINTGWNNFSAAEQVLLCKYLTNMASPTNFASAVEDASERSAIANNFDIKSTEARQTRYQAARLYTFGCLYPVNGLEVVDDIPVLLIKYFGGIEYKEADGKDGLIDYADSTVGTSFEGAGLRAKGFTTLYGETILPYQTFCTNLVNILKYGTY